MKKHLYAGLVSALIGYVVILIIQPLPSNAADNTGTNGNDILFFEGSVQTLSTTITNPYTGESINLSGEYNVNTSSYDGLAGNDILFQTNTGDFLNIRDELGNITIQNIEVILNGGGNDVTSLADPTIDYGDVTVSGGPGDDIIWTSSGNDINRGFAGNDIINAGPGNDFMIAGDGDDEMRGGPGHDRYIGGANDDTNIFHNDHGHDVIDDPEGINTIKLEGSFDIGSFSFVNSGNGLIIFTDATGQNSITLKDFVLHPNMISAIIFPDGTIVPPLGLSVSAGDDINAEEGTLVQLNGSILPEGLNTFEWVQTSGQTVLLNDADTLAPNFLAPLVPAGGETLSFSLRAEFFGIERNSSVNVTVINGNNAPVADAGDPQFINEGTLVTLDGSESFDSDGDALTFIWGAPVGIDLSDPNSSTPSFVAPDISVASQIFTFSLQVDDGFDLSNVATVEITVLNENQAPIANAGLDLVKDEGSTLSLDGTSSNDPEGQVITYFWQQNSGTPVGLSDPTSATPFFVAPAVSSGGEMLGFSLVVTDTDPTNSKSSEPDTVIVSVRNANDPPACDLASPSQALLWPPNHKMKQITINNVMDRDSDAYPDFTLIITDVTQDEPTEGLGDGDSSPDASIVALNDEDTVFIRSERAGGGNGRAYEINFTADDGFESCNGSVTVSVPHSRKSTAVNDGQIYDAKLP